MSLILPDTVTRPGLDGCLNWRWPPLDLTRTQPSDLSRRSTSRTFIPKLYPDGTTSVKRPPRTAYMSLMAAFTLLPSRWYTDSSILTIRPREFIKQAKVVDANK